jgi:PRTRC genetic system protein A
VKRVGYLINTESGLVGESEIYYDYILAGNGVSLKAENHLIKATITIAETAIRGLQPLQQRVEISHGLIPRYIYDLALSTLMADPYEERLVAVLWDEGYHLKVPEQEAGECSIRYQTLPDAVLEFHSHGLMDAFFSMTDNRDEQGLCIYAVAGRMDRLIPDVNLRLGIYGYFAPVQLSEIFNDALYAG